MAQVKQVTRVSCDSAPCFEQGNKDGKEKIYRNFSFMQQYMVGHLIGQELNYSEKHETRVVEYEC